MQETQIWVQPLGQEDSPGGGKGNPLQYSCLGNSMDRGAWWATVTRGHKKSDKTDCAHTHTHTHTHTSWKLGYLQELFAALRSGVLA